jgi:hypothetical protein
MGLPPNDSPVWSIAKIAVLGLVLALMLHVGYQNGFDLKADLPTITAVLLSAGGMEAVAKLFGRGRQP